jgi:hypothetical protein
VIVKGRLLNLQRVRDLAGSGCRVALRPEHPSGGVEKPIHRGYCELLLRYRGRGFTLRQVLLLQSSETGRTVIVNETNG